MFGGGLDEGYQGGALFLGGELVQADAGGFSIPGGGVAGGVEGVDGAGAEPGPFVDFGGEEELIDGGG